MPFQGQGSACRMRGQAFCVHCAQASGCFQSPRAHFIACARTYIKENP